jgi:hypothetical protein
LVKSDLDGKELQSYGQTTRPPVAVDDDCLYVNYPDIMHDHLEARVLQD